MEENAGVWILAGAALLFAILYLRSRRQLLLFRRTPLDGALEKKLAHLHDAPSPPPGGSEPESGLAAAQERFLLECSAAHGGKERVALVLVRLDAGLHEPKEFLKQLERTLRSAIRANDWMTVLPEQKMLFLIGRMITGEGGAFLARVVEVVRREELAWCAGRSQARSSAAVAVFPTDGMEFNALVHLARRRLDKGICWNIPSSP